MAGRLFFRGIEMRKTFLFLIFATSAFATEIPPHQQQIENTAPTQNQIDLSAKKLREHKDIEIGAT